MDLNLKMFSSKFKKFVSFSISGLSYRTGYSTLSNIKINEISKNMFSNQHINPQSNDHL